jgi:hypothetical protein
LERVADPREDGLVRASREIVRVKYLLQRDAAAQADVLALLQGENTIRAILPSLSENDTHRLAALVVDISSWSLRHLLQMPLPRVVGEIKGGVPPYLVEVDRHKRGACLIDEHNAAHLLDPIVVEILGTSEMDTHKILEAVHARGLRFIAAHSEELSAVFREALKKAPSLKYRLAKPQPGAFARARLMFSVKA